VLEGDGEAWVAGSRELLERISIACLDRLAISGISLSVAIDAGIRIPVFISDPTAELLENLQYELGEGPSADSVTTRRPVHVDDLKGRAGVAQWPAFATAASAAGARAVFVYPLQLGGAQLGTLLMYRWTPGSLSLQQQVAALRLADAAFYAVLEAASGSLVGAERDGAELEAAWAEGSIQVYRAEVHQAAGMVMGQLGTSIEEATVRLRAYAFAHDRPVIEVARDIIARELRLDDDNEPHRRTDRQEPS
jgi:ANTAR domain-containing protein